MAIARTLLTCALCLLPFALPSAAPPSAALLPAAPPAQAAVRIVLVGDSTVTDDSGWGLGFKQFAGSGVEVQEHGGQRAQFQELHRRRPLEGGARRTRAVLPDSVRSQRRARQGARARDRSGHDVYSEHAAVRRRRAGHGRDAGARDVARAPDLRSGQPERSDRPNGRMSRPCAAGGRGTGAARRSVCDAASSCPSVWAAQRSRNLSPRQPDGAIDTTHLNAKGSRRIRPAGRGRAAAGRARARADLSRRAGAGGPPRDAAQRRCDRCGSTEPGSTRPCRRRSTRRRRTRARRSRWIILVKPGTYREVVYVQREKRFVSLVGRGPGAGPSSRISPQGLGHRARRQADRHVPDTPTWSWTPTISRSRTSRSRMRPVRWVRRWRCGWTATV